MLKRKTSSDGLIGMWTHIYDDDGNIRYQAQVFRRSGDVYLCQVYSWQNGSATDCIAIPRSKILGLKLYASFEAMDTALVKHLQQQKWKRRTSEMRRLSSSPSLAAVS